jgi:hypothetical protein
LQSNLPVSQYHLKTNYNYQICVRNLVKKLIQFNCIFFKPSCRYLNIGTTQSKKHISRVYIVFVHKNMSKQFQTFSKQNILLHSHVQSTAVPQEQEADRLIVDGPLQGYIFRPYPLQVHCPITIYIS